MEKRPGPAGTPLPRNRRTEAPLFAGPMHSESTGCDGIGHTGSSACGLPGLCHTSAVSSAEECNLTALVCTCNHAALLRRALSALADMDVPPGFRWEVVVVDNNCTDETPEVVREFMEGGQLPDVRLIRESRQGVAFARKAGFALARGALVVFVDDDCLLARDWLVRMHAFAQAHPRAGVWGGRNELEWEEPPNVICEAYGESFARQDLGPEAFRLPQIGRRCLCGAGLVLRREALLESGYLDTFMLISRHPRHLGAGEDSEIVFKIRRVGWEVWYEPALRLRHVIPAQRTSQDYLNRLHRGYGRAEPYLNMLAQDQRPTLANRLGGLRDALVELWQVIARFPKGYIRFINERPTWLIRWHHAMGRLTGALKMLFLGRTRN